MALDELLRMARAVEEDWCRAWASLARVTTEPRTIVEGTPAFLRVYTPGVREPLLNLIMRYRMPGRVGVAEVEQMLAPYFTHRLPTQWWLLRGDEPEGLREALREVGMQSWGGSTAMAASLADPEPPYVAPPRGIEMSRVSGGTDGEAALRVIAQVFYIAPEPMRRWSLDNPALRLYAAKWNGQVVCALTTLLTGESVGVTNVATLSGARRRGIAGNLVRYALREAHTDGCTQATLTATHEARRLYEELGFRGCGVIEQWLPGYQLMAQLTGSG